MKQTLSWSNCKVNCPKCNQEWYCPYKDAYQKEIACPSCVSQVSKTATRSLARAVAEDSLASEQAARQLGMKIGYAKAVADIINYMRSVERQGEVLHRTPLEKWAMLVKKWRLSADSDQPPELK